MHRFTIAALTLGVGLSLSSIAHAQPNLQQRETELLKEWKQSPQPETALQLALVREQLGKWTEALNTLAMVKSRWNKTLRTPPATAVRTTYGQSADFFTRRIQRRQNLQRNPVVLTPQLRRKLADAMAEFKGNPGVDQLDLAVQTDLDGDGIDEILYKASAGPIPGKRKPSAIGIAKWNGSAYKVVWRDQKRIPFMVHITDYDADGWKEVFCGYTPDSDDAATLAFNGTTALYY